ncbi:hypothetical protein L0B53_08625 [Vibrio sp. SS-MA-C1-2]|uniref:hypothetical protein n=1 Tax=Vibrio sp. SS-MA-C1-2 TaxID=2908646 RepID=UPI001F23FFC3|nr:hypothetical protein [Vibrio sp. SS-MA-C1-2]UJF19559.1 hypothetical protein L0B53_08625 [Vibrio sp. SS-MA-C1-2]
MKKEQLLHYKLYFIWPNDRLLPEVKWSEAYGRLFILKAPSIAVFDSVAFQEAIQNQIIDRQACYHTISQVSIELDDPLLTADLELQKLLCLIELYQQQGVLILIVGCFNDQLTSSDFIHRWPYCRISELKLKESELSQSLFNRRVFESQAHYQADNFDFNLLVGSVMDELLQGESLFTQIDHQSLNSKV